MTTCYPDNYDEEDKAVYDDLILKGKQMIGSKIKENESYLIELGARMTIFQMKNPEKISNMTVEEIEARRAEHLKALRQPVHMTPLNLFEEGKNPLELNIPNENMPVDIMEELEEEIDEVGEEIKKLNIELDEKISHLF